MTADRERLLATLGRPELARLLMRLRSRLERGTPLAGCLDLQNATPAERDAVDRLLGRAPGRGNAVSVSLSHLEQKLRAAGICPSLRQAVEILTGPVVDRRAQQAATEREWDQLFAKASESIAIRPELQAWLGQLRASGHLRRYGLDEARQLLAQAFRVLAALPAADIPIAELAASLLGDAHALDPDTSLGGLTLRAAAALSGCDRFEDAHSRREAWARVGVICDELSGPVLVLNLRAAGETPTSEVLAICAAAGEPAFLTTRQLLGAALTFTLAQAGPVVYICENPSILAAAARRLGASSKPLVCIEGQPRTATRLLLNRLREAQVELRYHGDFDWPGLQIANTILERHGVLPWRMGPEDYRAAATGCLPLSGDPVAASWDPGLMPAMLQLSQAVHEERVAEHLLSDLGR